MYSILFPVLQCSSHDVNLIASVFAPTFILEWNLFIFRFYLTLMDPGQKLWCTLKALCDHRLLCIHTPSSSFRAFASFCLFPGMRAAFFLTFLEKASHGMAPCRLTFVSRPEFHVCFTAPGVERFLWHLEQNAEMHLVCRQTVVCWGIGSGFQLELEDIPLLKLCVTVSLGQADNLDMFNHNFPYRRTGKGLRVIFPEACGYISEIVWWKDQLRDFISGSCCLVPFIVFFQPLSQMRWSV